MTQLLVVFGSQALVEVSQECFPVLEKVFFSLQAVHH